MAARRGSRLARRGSRVLTGWGAQPCSDLISVGAGECGRCEPLSVATAAASGAAAAATATAGRFGAGGRCAVRATHSAAACCSCRLRRSMSSAVGGSCPADLCFLHHTLTSCSNGTWLDTHLNSAFERSGSDFNLKKWWRRWSFRALLATVSWLPVPRGLLVPPPSRVHDGLACAAGVRDGHGGGARVGNAEGRADGRREQQRAAQ